MINHSPQTTRDVKRINRSTLLKQIYFDAPTSRLSLSQRTNLSPATVTNLASDLLHEGIIVEVGLEESQGGRPRTTLAINPHYGYIIGIDLGETHISCELFDLQLRSIHQIKYDISSEENTPKAIARLLTNITQEVIAQSAINAEQIIGVGIGVPGVVNSVSGISSTAPNWGWQNVPLLDMLTKDLDLNILLDNGAQTMALAEMWFGSGKNLDNLAVLLVGTGVGSGIITGGKLYQGTSNSAGEWGHICIDIGGRECRCGSRGCLEAYVGAHGIIHRFNELTPNSPLIHQRGQVQAIEAIYQATHDGDPAAIQVMQELTTYIGVGIANIINLFNPQLITLGGWSGLMLGEYILPGVREVAKQHALHQPWDTVKIELSQMGEEAVNLGAACLVLEKFLEGQITNTR